jgi:hypothetical protein
MILKKKLFSSVLASALIIGGIATYPSFAKAETNTIDVYSLPGWHLYGVNAAGTKQELMFNPSERPFIYNNRIYVPVSVLVKYFGIATTYNPTDKTVTFSVATQQQPTGTTVQPTSTNSNESQEGTKENYSTDSEIVLQDYKDKPLPIPYNQKEWSPKNPLIDPIDYRAAGSLILNNAYSVDSALRSYLDHNITRSQFENELDSIYQEAATAWAKLSNESKDIPEAYDMYLVTKDIFNLAHEVADSGNLDEYTQKLRSIENQWLKLRWAIVHYKGYEEKPVENSDSH